MHVVGISGSLQARSNTAAVLASIADLVTARADAEAPAGAAAASAEAPTEDELDAQCAGFLATLARCGLLDARP